MDWNGAIERNSTALKRIVAMLVGMAGLNGAGQKPPSPSRAEKALDTSPPLREGEDRRPQAWRPSAPPETGGEVPSPAAKSPSGEAERGDWRQPRSTISASPTLPRRLHRAILRLLRPAESAVRRLIVIAARGLVVPPSPPPRPRKPEPRSIFTHSRTATGIYVPHGTPLPGRPPRPAPQSIALPLFDPLKRPFRRRRPTPVCEPRISCAGPFNKLSPVKIRRPPEPDDPLDAVRLTLRLNALAAALDDLPKQAHRLARWRANRARDDKRDAEAQFLAPLGRGAERSEAERGFRATSQRTAHRRFRRLSPLRPGRPPGSLRRPDHEVHALLTDLHGLAYDVLEHPDTS